MADYSYYTRRIRDIREDNDLTQQQIAEILGTSQTMYARYERGANELPIRHLIRLAEYYRLSTDYLLGLTNEKETLSKRKNKDEIRNHSVSYLVFILYALWYYTSNFHFLQQFFLQFFLPLLPIAKEHTEQFLQLTTYTLQHSNC